MQLLDLIWLGLILLRGSVSRQSELCPHPEAVQWEVVSTHIQTNTNCSWHVVNHFFFCFSVAGTEYRHLCWFLQPTTEQFARLTLSGNIAKHCCLTTGHTELHLWDELPLSDISYHCPEEACLWLFSLRINRSLIWTACRSSILPVGGLQRPCRDCLFSSFLELAGSGRTSCICR